MTGLRNKVLRKNISLFSEHKRCLREVETLTKQRVEQPDVVRAFESYILRHAGHVLLADEANKAREKMRTRHPSTQALCVSALGYQKCTGSEDERPLDPDATGIPAIRHMLYSLVAESNLEALRQHFSHRRSLTSCAMLNASLKSVAKKKATRRCADT